MATDSPRIVPSADIDLLIVELAGRVGAHRARFLLGITGPPGAGKSTLAHRVAAGVTAVHTAPSVVAPMDGFHLSNETLERRGLLELKGIPESFDGTGFVGHLGALRDKDTVEWPTFDRDRETVVPGGLRVEPETLLVVVEGNYLLLDTSPWDAALPLLDEVWYLDVPEEELIERLEARHRRYRSREDASAKVRSTDLPNTRLVAASKHRADVVVSWT